METQNKIEERIPSIRELIKWHNQFGRLLTTNNKRTKLFGVDGKEVKFISRSSPDFFHLRDRIEGEDSDIGYSHKTRIDGSESSFRLDCPNGRWEYLTYAECDLVLGSNYHVIDQGYSSPGPEIRKIVFKANEYMAHDYYNAFEVGSWSCGGGIMVPIIYYKIPRERFRELRDYKTDLKNLVEEVKRERKEVKGGNK